MCVCVCVCVHTHMCVYVLMSKSLFLEIKGNPMDSEDS